MQKEIGIYVKYFIGNHAEERVQLWRLIHEILWLCVARNNCRRVNIIINLFVVTFYVAEMGNKHTNTE